MDKEYIIFCDESDKKGKFNSNFYGGVMVGSSQYQRITDKLEKLKEQNHLFGEIKWEKVTEQYLDKYISMINAFFDEMENGHIKIRIMFRPNAYEYRSNSTEKQRDPYFLLYYQFIKHGFGLDKLSEEDDVFNLRLYFDTFPDRREKSREFVNFLLTLPDSKAYKNCRFTLSADNIAEVDSKNHVILQCLDIILGSMSFRLNEKHLEKPPDKYQRGRRTIAKEKLYKNILNRIRRIHPGFNIGQSTSLHGDSRKTWTDPYQHWRFIPKDHEVRREYIKNGNGNKKNPTSST
jgi:RNA binding exosome subunit